MKRQVILIGGVLIIAMGVVGLVVLLITSDPKETSTTSEPHTPTIGVLVPAELAAILLKNQMAELGYVEGETIQYVIEPISDPAGYTATVQSLLDAQVDIIVSTNIPPGLIASEHTSTIPIIILGEQKQFVDSIVPIRNQQGSQTNITGVITPDATQRRFELMMETIPSIKVVYEPYDPSDNLTGSIALIDEMAAKYGVTVKKYEFSSSEEAQLALESIPEDADAILLGTETPILVSINAWATAAIEHHIPLVLSLGQFIEGSFPTGVLIGYGTGIEELYQQIATLIDQLLNGTTPADLPPRPSDTYFTISLGAADALDIKIPDSILDQATQIIRDEILLPDTTQAAQTAVDDGTACTATLVTPLGENTICMTQSCDLMQDSGFATFTNKTSVESCSTENVLGVCASAAVDTYFYSGDVSAIEGGCATNGGVWQVTPN